MSNGYDTDDTEFSFDSPSVGGDWNERKANYRPGSMNISLESISDEILISIPWSKVYDACLTILGFHEVRGGFLVRHNPLRHPIFDYLYATKILSIQGMKFDGFHETFGLDQPHTADYVRAQIRIAWEPLPFAVLDDDEIDDETQRYCTTEREPSVETVRRDGNQFLFRDFGGGTPAGSFGLITPKSTITLKWWFVPENFIIDDNGVETNLLSCVGKLNDDVFLGRPAGTLLCEPQKLEQHVMPLRTAGGGATGLPMFYYHVYFTFRYFDPNPAGSGPFSIRGHNLLPDVTGDYRYAESTIGNHPVYQSASFPVMFTQPPPV